MATNLTWVAKLRTCCTNSCVSEGFFRNSFTMAVSKVSWTCRQTKWHQYTHETLYIQSQAYNISDHTKEHSNRYQIDHFPSGSCHFVWHQTWVLSSWKPSRKLSRSSSALSILSAYSPTIQIIAARASGSSRESRFSHKVAMMLSYLHKPQN